MTSNDPFKILGLKRKGATLKSVQKAYAVQLKKTRPDDDPEGFMALRDAYTNARNHVRWNTPDEDEQTDTQQETTDEDNNEEQSIEEEVPQEEIQYWYDEKLEYNFNSSPYGKIVEKTLRWMKEDNGKQPKAFITGILKESALQDKAQLDQYSNFILGRIYYDAGGEDYYGDDDEAPLDEPDFTKPKWLTIAAILTINEKFPYHDRQPQYEWDARQLNCVNQFFDPVLVKEGILKKPTKKYDILDFRAKETTEYNKDDHGSFYDKEKRKWVDMSPIGIAMRDIEKIIEAPWGNADLEGWKEIISRDELQVIDQFQTLDNRVRYLICEKTGFNEEPSPELPRWLSKEVINYLNQHFGWEHQTTSNTWEYDHYRWVHQIVGRKQTSFAASNFQQYRPQTDVEKFGYQPIPNFLNPLYIGGAYLVYRIILLLVRM